MTRERRLTKAVKEYDRQLFCKKSDNGTYYIYRKTTRVDLEVMPFGPMLIYRPHVQHIMALTDNWQAAGKSVEWGVEPIKARLKAMDMMNNPKYVDELLGRNEKVEESKQRDYKNNVESFLRDFRREFAKSTNDINTSTLSKFDKRRMKDGFSKSR